MRKLKWNWVYYPYLDAPNEQEESAQNAGYVKVVNKDEADSYITELKAENKRLKRALKREEDKCRYFESKLNHIANKYKPLSMRRTNEKE